ncbi:DUF2975 domain-containing protein [Chitinophaga pinensis]|uniref:DUF2975 domain-containing protein n=1 Tax=Chitinophaga pinensis (strain ATCC 43595 / DSM 2588 / LMG 13176 / NBRC 15968 / NCIMB 11800 / UQM 2034) TaxID=485918 RepID=A0A979G9A2_CHIPD|nr:DUF2975 domain-containing protein [Chitinophaga pinensis]ACU63180.1 hypothetical protein Cpin_5759 [Chitinophaga pinensis DSM 2588]
MKPKSIIKILNILITSTYYLTLLIAILLTSLWIFFFVTGNSAANGIPGGLTHEVISFAKTDQPAIRHFTADSTIAYAAVQNKYILNVKPFSGLGSYSHLYSAIKFVIWLLILRTFMNIFNALDPERPFTSKIVVLLKQLSILFVAADVFKILHYAIFSRFMHNLASSLQFSLNIEIGSGIITGLIIWIIAVVYQRGLEMQTESELTV